MRAIMLLLLALGPATATITWKPLWDAKTLNGWHNRGKTAWTVEKETPASPPALRGRHLSAADDYSMLYTDAQYDFFTVRVNYKLVRGNSGVYVKARELTATPYVAGIQVDIEAGGGLSLYCTSCGGGVYTPPADILSKVSKDGYNALTITVKGDLLYSTINGANLAPWNFKGKEHVLPKGPFGLQLHDGQINEAWFRDIEIMEGCTDKASPHFDKETDDPRLFVIHNPANCSPTVSVLWPVGGRAEGQVCADPQPADFKKTNLAPGFFREPVELSVAKDGRVFVAERGGRLAAYDPATGQTTAAATFEVVLDGAGTDKGGLLAVAVGPTFAQDNWVYVLYAPKDLWNGSSTFATGKFVYRLSRLKYLGTKLDRPSEQVLLEFPVQWELHQAGSMIFGKDGNLYLSTGDNSAPWSNDQFSPMDERPGFEYSDDQRSTANTNDLRGKILRIHPEPGLVNGKYYSIPKGNLFPILPGGQSGTDKARAEIYTMGHRNPYRIHADAVTGRLFIAEFGPAALRDTERGPAGADELSITDEAANMGYPYFNKDNQPYCHWDYGQGKCAPIQGQTSLKYDPLRPVNYSRNNTGLNVLPPAKPAALWEHDGSNPDPVPGLEGCGFGVGPVYHFDPSLASKVKFPPWFDGKGILYAIGGPWQPKVLVIPPGPPSTIKQVLAAPFSLNFGASVHDMEYGPDGSLYVVDYEGGNNGLHKVTYNGCLPPVAVNPVIGAGDGSSPSLRKIRVGSLGEPLGLVFKEEFDVSGRKVWSKRIHLAR